MKVTKEIADFIYRKKLEKDSLNDISEEVFRKFDVRLSESTIWRYRKYPFEKAREKLREYRQKPEVKERKRRYYRWCSQKIDLILDSFQGEEYSAQELAEQVKLKIEYKPREEAIRAVIARLEEGLGEISPIIYDAESQKYRLNEKSPYRKMCGEF